MAVKVSAEHPDLNLLTAFAEHSLGDKERAVVIAHLAECTDCRELLVLAADPGNIGARQNRGHPRLLGWFEFGELLAYRKMMVTVALSTAVTVVIVASFGTLWLAYSTHQGELPVLVGLPPPGAKSLVGLTTTQLAQPPNEALPQMTDGIPTRLVSVPPSQPGKLAKTPQAGESRPLETPVITKGDLRSAAVAKALSEALAHEAAKTTQRPFLETQFPKEEAPNQEAADDVQAIARTLRDFQDAYQRMDVQKMKRLWSRMNEMNSEQVHQLWRNEFVESQVRGRKLSMTTQYLLRCPAQSVVSGDSAVVTCERIIVLQDKIGGTERMEDDVSITLKRLRPGTIWIVRSFTVSVPKLQTFGTKASRSTTPSR
jgi:hypothetical protein